MAQYSQKKPSTPMDKMMTAIVVVVILAVLGLAVFATYSKISANITAKKIETENTAIQNGEQEPNIRYLASQSGSSVDEYLKQYGIALKDGLTEESTQTEMMEKMTVENYYKYSDAASQSSNQASKATPTDVNQVLTDWKASDFGITKDTLWSDVEAKLPISNYLGGEDKFKSLVDSYAKNGYDISSITKDTKLKDAQDKIQTIVNAGPTSTVAPTATPAA